MEAGGFVPSETPFAFAQFMPAAYHGVPLVSAPAMRARMVMTMPRVVDAAGENFPVPVPFISPFSTA